MSDTPEKLFSGDPEIAELQEGFMILSKIVLSELSMYPGDATRLRALRKKIEDRRNNIPPAAR